MVTWLIQKQKVRWFQGYLAWRKCVECAGWTTFPYAHPKALFEDKLLIDESSSKKDVSTELNLHIYARNASEPEASAAIPFRFSLFTAHPTVDTVVTSKYDDAAEASYDLEGNNEPPDRSLDNVILDRVYACAASESTNRLHSTVPYVEDPEVAKTIGVNEFNTSPTKVIKLAFLHYHLNSKVFDQIWYMSTIYPYIYSQRGYKCRVADLGTISMQNPMDTMPSDGDEVFRWSMTKYTAMVQDLNCTRTYDCKLEGICTCTCKQSSKEHNTSWASPKEVPRHIQGGDLKRRRLSVRIQLGKICAFKGSMIPYKYKT
ncbi:hypothetical protein OBBRIDRAFT_804070 [Obba rivulosa]|uniref:Uncharacterized protein n=1 Tax=Obba rivulosa TaxID=1052685 RepID=A0A8E2DLV8_9APHY|nr:hypothetical protein OBBRIDRAFT_804070 [Obba rivulosa]